MSNIEKQAELATNIKLSFRQRLDYSISEFGYNSTTGSAPSWQCS